MGKRRRTNKDLRYFLMAAAFGALISAYSNCSDINIQQGQNTNSSVVPTSVQKGEYDLCPKGTYISDTFFLTGGSSQQMGPMANGSVFTIKMIIPQSASNYGEIYASSIDSGTQYRTASISETACDFSKPGSVSYQTVTNKKTTTTWLWLQDSAMGYPGNIIKFDFPISDDGSLGGLVRGKTYYLNIRGDSGCENQILGECPLGHWTWQF